MTSTIAVTVIGGYLGAGKTTLVNEILRSADERIAVLVNDFGEINIDADLITRHDGETIELANGCICCSLVDGLAGALTTINELDPRPQRLVIEASGVADPATVAAYGHGPGYALDAVIVLADAETVEAKSTDRYVGDTVLGQLGSGDIIVVNKVDLVDESGLERLRAWLTERWPDALVHETEHAVVPLQLLFGHEWSSRSATDPEGGHHAHFESWSWASLSPTTRDAVEAAMAELPDEVYRLKGVVVLSDGPHVLQRVGRRWSLRRSPPGPTESTVVAIGRPGALDDRWLADHLETSS